jgi:hypothetical protein
MICGAKPIAVECFIKYSGNGMPSCANFFDLKLHKLEF